METKETFEKIYREGGWDSGTSETRSGPGSTLSATVELRAWLRRFIEVFKIHSLLDAPCGEWGWMSQLDLRDCSYTGIDVAEAPVAKNRSLYPNHQFILGHIGEAALPQVDLILCKDCFQHLPNAEIQKCLNSFISSGSTFLITSMDYFPPPVSNLRRSEAPGGYSPENLHEAPFNLSGWIGNVQLDRKFYAVWRLSGEDRGDDLGRLAQTLDFYAAAVPQLPVPLSKTSEIAASFKSFPVSEQEFMVVPDKYGVLCPGSVPSLPKSVVDVMNVLIEVKTVGDFCLVVRNRLEASCEHLELFLFLSSELGFVKGLKLEGMNAWDRKLLFKQIASMPGRDPCGLKRLVQLLIYPTEGWAMQHWAKDKSLGLYHVLSWLHASGSEFAVLGGVTEANEDWINVTISMSKRDFDRTAELLP